MFFEQTDLDLNCEDGVGCRSSAIASCFWKLYLGLHRCSSWGTALHLAESLWKHMGTDACFWLCLRLFFFLKENLMSATQRGSLSLLLMAIWTADSKADKGWSRTRVVLSFPPFLLKIRAVLPKNKHGRGTLDLYLSFVSLSRCTL